MRKELLKRNTPYYWTHDGVLELVFGAQMSDGTLGFVNRKGEIIKVEKEDDIVPFSASYYKQFVRKYDKRRDNRDWQGS